MMTQNPYHHDRMLTILNADVLVGLNWMQAGSVHCCVTSPPYWGLRDYGVAGQIGQEASPEEYIDGMVRVFREVRRVLRPDGTLWLNLGDTYNAAGRTGQGARQGCKQGTNRASAAGADACRGTAPGLKEKDLVGIPWRTALALQADGWCLRSEIIWHKPGPMPESVRDRPTRAHEHIFLLTPAARYFYDGEAVKTQGVEPGTKSNRRTVWTVPTAPYRGAHFACFPPKLIDPCVLAGTSAAGVCPACGAQWRRVVGRRRVPTRPGKGSKVSRDWKGAPPLHPDSPLRAHAGDIAANRDPRRHCTVTATTGWEPGCGCDAAPPGTGDGIGPVRG